MLFHAGAVWRLSDVGLLRQVDLISGVSGGSIAAALLGLNWSKLDFEGDHPTALLRSFIDPLRRLAGARIDFWAVARALVDPRYSAGERVAAALARHLFSQHTLQDLPDAPIVVINATNVQSLSAWRFSKRLCGDTRVGWVCAPEIDIATAVAASAAYSPFLGPVRLRLDSADFLPGSGADLQSPPYTTKVALADGASIDGLGISAAWEECGTVLISDALKSAPPVPGPPKTWVGALQRTRSILEQEMHDVRVESALAGFSRGTHAGAYWSIGDPSALTEVPGALARPAGWDELPRIRTRLGPLHSHTQEELINWGYAIADAALRVSLDSSLPAPTGLPYPSGSESG